MTSHSIAEQEDPLNGLPPTDDESDFEGDMTEEEIKMWCSTTYDRGSRFRKPMKEPLTAPWGLPISNADMEKIKVGFKSRSMDDKYDLKVEDPDENGNVSLHIIRNWLQEECYILHFVPGSGSAEIHSITWEGNKSGLQCDAEQAKKQAIILARIFLHCDFEALPHHPSSVMWQGYKKLDAE
ncbi:hypothetical protein Daus18300_012416 [Diaporthe australafricana]|uniref:Uncharacterized protein n=1 Tax=Diaporthe australafricana TaxID=127596 RepID=A0ABR3W2U1_9PEZI